MKTLKSLAFCLIIAAAFYAINGCENEESNDNNNGEDWATLLIGTYTHEYDYSGNPIVTMITVRKVGNKKISLKLYREGITGWVQKYDFCLDSVILTSEYHCTFNEHDSCYSGEDETCYAIGTADFTPNSIEVDWDEIRIRPGYSDTININITATK